MPSRRGFATICFFAGNPPMFALEKRYNKTYGRRLGQDISDFLHMDRQRPDHKRALFFGNTLFSDISLSTLKSKSGHNGFSWRAFRTQASQVCQSLPGERRVK